MQAGRFDLDRFKSAQASVYADVVRELGAGRKRTHWMWFIFPQVEGLGSSPMAMRYAIASAEEARAYLDDPLLGQRIRECTRILVDLPETNATAILGLPDDMKFKSSLTLFAAVSPEPLFQQALDKFFGGEKDARTLAFLER